MKIDAVTVEIAKLDIGPGDRLMVRIPRDMKHEHAVAFYEELRLALPGIDVLMVQGDVEFSVVRRDDE
jgi:protein involved in polysaccharide export with SLBB domain